MKLRILTVALGLTSLFLITPTYPGLTDVDVDIYKFCSKFPLNSRCEGFEIPIPLENRQGNEAECSLAFGEIKESSDCKFVINNDNLTVYIEEGEPISALDNERASREILIPLNQVFALNYLEYDQDNQGATAAFGLIGALFSKSEQLSEVEVGFTEQLESGKTNYNFLLMVSDRDIGKNLKTQLEQSTNIKVGSQVDEIVENWLAESDNTIDYSEQIKQLVETRSCKNCDFHGADLRELNLMGVNLQSANLERVNLKGVNLEEANLEGANLRGANLENAILSHANLTTKGKSRTSLRYANLKNANLTDTELKGADLGRANLSGANLTKANLASAVTSNFISGMNRKIYTNLSGANLRDTNLTEAQLDHAFLESANLENANLTGADLEEATLNKANLQEANLSKCDLEDASLIEVNLLGANLTEADLEDANLCGAIMPDGSISKQNCQ